MLSRCRTSKSASASTKRSSLQSNHRSKFGDDDAAREAAGSAAMLRQRVKELNSGSAWRKAAKLMPRKLIGVRERVHTSGSARNESVREIAELECRRLRVSVCVLP